VLADDRLSVGSVIEEESSSPAGTVLRTNPRAGTAVWPGSSVDLVIAKRREVVVPNVVGVQRVQAARVLADDGLSVGAVTEEESSQPAGTVLRTNPKAGTTVRSGSAVNLVIAKAPKDPPAKDPAPKDTSAKALPAKASSTDDEPTPRRNVATDRDNR
jgi:serine/threonine-protein kinase